MKYSVAKWITKGPNLDYLGQTGNPGQVKIVETGAFHEVSHWYRLNSEY